MASFRSCAVVPTYNHHLRLAEVVSGLRAQGLDVIIVDDGSAAPTACAVDALAAADAAVSVVRLSSNRGKGGAVMAGFRAAIARGYSHALQIDADGQHDPSIAHLFLDRGRARPDLLISGVAVYDESVPALRKYGRYLTHVCVWIETASLAISDSMCGYRLYPLGPIARLLERFSFGTRMDFDIEMLVKARWAGIPFENLPVQVVYPPDNSSNFRALRDNVRISWMHTRLLAQAPFRLLARTFSAAGSY
jgi:glycosyltransferase involved in cell wall biosynthesis